MDSSVHLLKKIYCFRDLSENDIIRLRSVCREEIFQAGDVIFSEGNMEDCCFIVLEGIAEIRRAFGQADEEIIAECRSFQIYKETALFESRRREDTVLAKTSVRLLTIRKGDFEKISLQAPDMMNSIIRAVSDRIREKSENLISQLQSGTLYLGEIFSHLKKENSSIARRPALKPSLCHMSASM